MFNRINNIILKKLTQSYVSFIENRQNDQLKNVKYGIKYYSELNQA
jgi:hypothetical protein